MGKDTSLDWKFRILQLAVGTSDLGDGIFRVLIPLIGLTIDRSAAAVALVSLSVRMPGPLVTIPISYLLDMSNRRLIFSSGSALIRVLCIAALSALVVTKMIGIGTLCLIAFVAIAASNTNDLAVQASIPSYVTKDRLPQANSWVYTAQVLLVQMIGPSIAGMLVGHANHIAAIALVSALFILAIVIFFTLAISDQNAYVRNSTIAIGGLFYGFMYIFRDSSMLQLALLAALNNLCYAMIFTFLPAWIVSPGPVHGTTVQYGWTISIMAIGSLFGGFFGVKFSSVLTNHRITRYSFLVIAISFSLIITGKLALIMIGLAIYGATSTMWSVRIVSFRQAVIPQEFFGRVNGAFRWFSLCSPPIGAILAGIVAGLFGIKFVFVAAIVPCYLAAAISLARPIHI